MAAAVLVVLALGTVATALLFDRHFDNLRALLAAIGAKTALIESRCTANIEQIPFIITSPGRYCLSRTIDNSAVEHDAILIRSDNVIIDGQGFTLSGPSDPAMSHDEIARRIRATSYGEWSPEMRLCGHRFVLAR